MTDTKCYHIACKSNELCVPSSKLNSETAEHLTLVLVKPTDDESWEEVLRRQDYLKEQLDKEMYNILSDRSRFEDAFRDLLKEEAFDKDTYYCDVNANGMCIENEICVPQHLNSRAGKIKCIFIFIKNFRGSFINSTCFFCLLWL